MYHDQEIDKLLIKISQIELERDKEIKGDCRQWWIDSLNGRIEMRIQRILALERLDNMPEKFLTYERGAVFNNVQANRIQVEFIGGATVEEATLARVHGFRWSEREQVWQRLRSRSSMIAAINIFSGLGKVRHE